MIPNNFEPLKFDYLSTYPSHVQSCFCFSHVGSGSMMGSPDGRYGSGGYGNLSSQSYGNQYGQGFGNQSSRWGGR